MNKILKLFINENIKTWKKLSTKIMIVVAILAILGTLGLVKIMEKSVQTTYQIANNMQLEWKESIQQELKYMEEQLKNEALDENTKTEYKRQIEVYKICLQYDVSPWQDNWKNDLINQIAQLKIQKEFLSENEVKEIDLKIEDLIKKLEKDDFKGYIDLQIQEEKTKLDNKEISEQEYKDNIEILNLTKNLEIGKETNEAYWKRRLLNKIREAQTSIRTNIDAETNKVLSIEKKQEYQDLIKIDKYKLENNIAPLEYTESYRIMFETLAPMFGVAVIAIIVLVIAGGTISTEVSTGSIKFWALTPNKRWKILTSKILSVLFYIIVITLLITILTVIIANVFFDDAGEQYIYVKDGELKVINSTVFTFEKYFIKMITVTVFALFAIMLSTLTRNSATSISFSLALYLGNGIAMSIINSFIKSEWIKFVPFNNLNIFDKIFTNYTSPINFSMGTSFTATTSLTFSLIVLGVCAVLMLVTMYDSFNKRDII